jgi:hypothetical protein
MYSPTYGELKSMLLKELDLEDEKFITEDELLNYFNTAIDEVESAIHTIYEDYFLHNETIGLVSGQAEYDLPEDIYAQKIRALLYNDNGTKKYFVKRVKKLEETMWVENEDYYRYLILNSPQTGIKAKLFPTPQETNNNLTIYYLRNAKRFEEDTDVCDIPEFTHVIVQYVRWKCLSKEGHPQTQVALADLDRMRQDMIETLTARVPDEDNFVMMDTSFYIDFDDWRRGGYY